MAHCTATAPSGLNASVMSLAISGGGPGWLLRAAIAAATACAAASAACLAWYSASPCLSSSDHDWTCAICAAWTRCGFLVCCITELRSKALSWVTATATERWAGGSNRGKITVTRITTHTSTARNSGSNPYCAPSLDSPYPGGGFRPELGATWRRLAQDLGMCHLTTRSATFHSRTRGYRKGYAVAAATVPVSTL